MRLRKRNINLFFDTFMWYLIYLFPLFVILIMSRRDGGSAIDFAEFFTVNGYNILTDGIVYRSLCDLFGPQGVLPMFSSNNSGMLYYGAWFVSCMLIHLAVDFVLFVPRLAHKYMHVLCRDDD